MDFVGRGVAGKGAALQIKALTREAAIRKAEIAAKEILHIRGRLNEILTFHTGQSVDRIAEDVDRDR